jgi:dihydroneopterin aldolase/2-amino-4-hydroxy-6-hydroxymethyldihydropteridine diphosphokinase
MVIDETDLVVPDPDILSRPFLAVPLLELVPDLRLPGSGLLLADQSVCRETHEMEPMSGLTERLRERVQQ